MLRLLVIALVIANLLFFGWSRGWLDGVVGAPASGERDPQRLVNQVRPEVIRLWPGEAAPLDVARWVEPRLSRLSRLHAAMARDLVEMSGLGGLGSVTVDGARYPAAGLALLYLAERACRLVAPAPLSPLLDRRSRPVSDPSYRPLPLAR